MIQISSTTPAAPTGFINGAWQLDTSGHASVCVPTFPAKLTVTPTAGILTLDVSLARSFFVNIGTAPITAVSIINPAGDGQEITIVWAQGASPQTVTLPTNLLGAIPITTNASQHTCQKFTFNSADLNWYGIGSTNF